MTVVKRRTGGKGVDLVIDPIGGKSWNKSYRALRPAGRLGMFGVSTLTESTAGRAFQFVKLIARMPWFNPLRLMNANKGVFGVNLGHMWNEAEKTREWMQTLLRGVEEGWVRPHVDRAFPLERAGDAHTYIEQRRNIGKVVLTNG